MPLKVGYLDYAAVTTSTGTGTTPAPAPVSAPTAPVAAPVAEPTAPVTAPVAAPQAPPVGTCSTYSTLHTLRILRHSYALRRKNVSRASFDRSTSASPLHN